MIISIDVVKAFDQIQHPFIIKTLSKVGSEGTYLNIIKAIYISAESFSCKISNNTRCPLLPLLFNIELEYLTTEIREEKEIKSAKFKRKK